MPKGQYERKPRTPKVKAPVEPQNEWGTAQNAEVSRLDALVSNDAEVERIAALLVPAAPVAPQSAPRTKQNFDEWMAEEPVMATTNDRTTTMVREWAALISQNEHEVTWYPAEDGTGMTVLLVTPHGASRLTADAGHWTEADIAKALDAMRKQLGV